MSDGAPPDAPGSTERMQGADRGEGRVRPSAAATWLAVLGRAARHPEEPALFHPDGFDVRWRSWRVVAEQAGEGATALRRALPEPPEPRVALSWRAHPDAVAGYLAIVAAGGRPVAVAAPAEAVAAGCAAWLVQPEEAPPDFGRSEAVPTVSLPEAAGAGAAAAPDTPGPAVDPPAEVAALGARIARAAAASDAAGATLRPGAREIALAHLDLHRPGDEAFLGWALATGAALVLEPDRRAVTSFAAWARPTLVAAGAHELAELARWLRGRVEGRSVRARLARRLAARSARPAGARRPFGRLRLLVVLGDGRLPVDDVPFWADRGVAVVRALAGDSEG